MVCPVIECSRKFCRNIVIRNNSSSNIILRLNLKELFFCSFIYIIIKLLNFTFISIHIAAVSPIKWTTIFPAFTAPDSFINYWFNTNK